jgi:hypothetical protein
MKSSRDRLPDRTGPFTTALTLGVPGDQGGRSLRDLRLSDRLYPRHLLAPRVGQAAAVVVEAPIILTASWFVCRWCVDRLDVRRTVPALSFMGLVAFLALMSAEFGLGAVFGRPLVDQLATYGTRPGAIGLAAQVIFAAFLVIQF